MPKCELCWIFLDACPFKVVKGFQKGLVSPVVHPPGQMTQLCELINKSGELLAKNLSHLDTVLGALDIQEHSLGVLAVL